MIAIIITTQHPTGSSSSDDDVEEDGGRSTWRRCCPRGGCGCTRGRLVTRRRRGDMKSFAHFFE